MNIPTERDQDDVTPHEEFEDFDQTDFLEEEDTEELDFTTDETYRGEPNTTGDFDPPAAWANRRKVL